VPQLDSEFRAALGNAVRLVHEADPAMLGSFTSAGQAAAGVVWAVGKANGHISPEGQVRKKDLAAALGVPVSLSGPGRRARAQGLTRNPWSASTWAAVREVARVSAGSTSSSCATASRI
jgi:hypothetical protein